MSICRKHPSALNDDCVDCLREENARFREALKLIHEYPYNHISHVYEIAGEALAPTLDRPVDANKGTGTPASQQPVEPGESGR
jgi:hypothetical protein